MIKKILHVIGVVVKSFIRGCVVALLILNMIMIVNVAQLMNDIDAKTDIMAYAFREYHKVTIESMTLLLKSQIATTELVGELRKYILEKSKTIDAEIADKQMLPNFMDLVKANVVISNITKGIYGSGTMFEFEGKTYILSAGHLDDPTDTFFVVEGNDYRAITLVKVNHKVDLALFEYAGEYTDLIIAKLSNNEPKVGDRVWAIGNPAVLEDAITSGTLVRKLGFGYLTDAKIYYGNSGGGLFNVKGELIGVNVAMMGVQNYRLGFTVNLSTIKAFIRGRIPSEV